MPAGVARLAEAGVRFIGPLWERDSKAGDVMPHAGQA
jgi:hypothetical protein